MVTTGRGGTVLASFRCNFTLNESGTGLASSLSDLIPGRSSSVADHADSNGSEDDRSPATPTVFRREFRHLSLWTNASLILESMESEVASRCMVTSINLVIDASSSSARRLLLYVWVTKSSS